MCKLFICDTICVRCFINTISNLLSNFIAYTFCVDLCLTNCTSPNDPRPITFIRVKSSVRIRILQISWATESSKNINETLYTDTLLSNNKISKFFQNVRFAKDDKVDVTFFYRVSITLFNTYIYSYMLLYFSYVLRWDDHNLPPGLEPYPTSSRYLWCSLDLLYVPPAPSGACACLRLLLHPFFSS